MNSSSISYRVDRSFKHVTLLPAEEQSSRTVKLQFQALAEHYPYLMEPKRYLFCLDREQAIKFASDVTTRDLMFFNVLRPSSSQSFAHPIAITRPILGLHDLAQNFRVIDVQTRLLCVSENKLSSCVIEDDEHLMKARDPNSTKRKREDDDEEKEDDEAAKKKLRLDKFQWVTDWAIGTLFGDPAHLKDYLEKHPDYAVELYEEMSQ